MKRSHRLLVLFLCLTMTALVFFSSLSVHATDDRDSLDETVEQINALDRTMTDIDYGKELKRILDDVRMFGHYIDSNKKQVSINLLNTVRDEIQPYVDEINRLQRGFLSNDNSEENKTVLRDLALEGLYVGTLAWIYYSNIEDATRDVSLNVTVEEEDTYLPSSEEQTVENYYLYLRDTALKGKPEAYFTKTESDTIYTYFTRLFRAIFEAKLSLLSPDDSITGAQRENILAALDQGIRDIKSCSYLPGFSAQTKNGMEFQDGEDGYPFKQIYYKTETLIQATDLFELLCPGKNFTDVDATRTLIADVHEAQHNPQINDCIETAFDGLLDSIQGEDTVGNQYVYGYLDSLRTSLSAAFDDANTVCALIDSRALLTDVFERYMFKMEKANAKDGLARTLSEHLKNTERYPENSETAERMQSLIHSAIAIIDGCATSDEITLEAARGEAQATLYDDYLHASEQVSERLSEPETLLATLTGDYASAKGSLSASDSVEKIGDTLTETQALFTETVAIAEAQAYLEKHKDLFDRIMKDGYPTINGLSDEDQAAAEAAIDDTADGMMSELAKEKLLTELDALGKAYRYLMNQKVASELTNPALTDTNDPLNKTLSHAKETLTEKISALDPSYDKLPALKDALKDCLSEAEAIREIVNYAEEEIRKDSAFSSYDEPFIEELYSACDDAVTAILADDREQSPATIRDQSVLKLSQMTASKKISLETDKATDALDKMEFLGKDDISDRKEELTELKQNALDAIEHASSPTDVSDLLDASFHTITELVEKAEADNLTISKDQACKELTDKADQIKDTIQNYEYMDEATKEELLDELEQITQDGKDQVNSSSDTDSVASSKQDQLDALDQIASKGDQKETEECLESVKDALEEIRDKKDDYSEEQFEKIEDFLDNAEDSLNNSSTRDEYLNTLDQVLGEVEQIPNRLEEAKSTAKDRLEKAYDSLKTNQEGYRPGDWSDLENIYHQALQDVDRFTSLSDSETAIQLADAKIAQMQSIRLSVLYTADKQLAPENTPSSDYLPWDGFYGSITATGGLPSNSSLFIGRVGRDSVDAIAKKIMAAAKDNRISDRDGATIPKDLNRLLKNCHVATGLDISLTPAEDGTTYSLSVLLPDETDLEHLIGLVFLCEDGSAEYYELDAEGLLVSFDVHHFSNYYIVCSNVVNLLPLIILLALILVAEIVVLAWLYLRKGHREKKASPLLSAAVLAQPYFPANGWITVSLLGVAIVLLGGWIATILILEQVALHRASRPILVEGEIDEQNEDMNIPVEEYAHTEEMPEEEPIPVLVGAEVATALPEPEPISELPEGEPIPVLPEPEAIPELPEARSIPVLPEPEPIPALPVAEIQLVLPVAEPTAETEEEPIPAYHDPEQYTGTLRGEINLDTLSIHFNEGETVTLNSMKQEKLLSPRVGYVKVLGRGEAEKPMTVVAQAFSASAKRKIEEAGGEAIVTHPSKERRIPKK